MGDYAFKNQLCMTASEVGKNCWKTSLSAETVLKMKQLVCANQCIAIGKDGCEVGILYGV